MNRHLGFFCALLMILPSCSRSPKGASPDKKEGLLGKFSEGKTVEVTPYTVTSREVPLTIETTGKTEAADRYEAKAPTDIKIKKINVEEGGRVSAGDPLVQFDDDLMRLRLNKAQAEEREGEAGLAYATFQQTNRERLIEEGKVSQLEAEGIDERAALYQAILDRAKAEINLYEQASDLSQLNSPISGIVTKKNATEGSNVSEGQPIIEVVRLDPIRFVLTVPVDQAASLEKNPEISIHFPGLPTQEFTGTIASIGAETKGEGHGVGVVITIPNSDFALKTDMMGQITIHTQGKRKLLLVTDSAIEKTEKSHFIYKIEGNKVKRVAVDLGDPLGGQPTITKGLTEGDLIVASANDLLKDGATVEVRKK